MNNENECSMCRYDIGDNSIIVEKIVNHLLCDVCIDSYITICTCTKKHNIEPTRLVLSNYDFADIDNPSTNLEYKDIQTNSEILSILAEPYGDKYYIIKCCRGCSFSVKDIETDFSKAYYSAVTHCVYKKYNANILEYVGDVLDDDFITVSKTCGADIGNIVDI